MNIKLSSVICILAWCNVFGVCWYGMIVESLTPSWYVLALLFSNIALFSGVMSWEKPTRPHKVYRIDASNQGAVNGAYQNATDPSDN